MATYTVTDYINQIRWVTNATDKGSGLGHRVELIVHDESGKDITSQFSPVSRDTEVFANNMSRVYYYLTEAQRTKVLATLNRKLSTAQSTLSNGSASQIASTMETIGLGPVMKKGQLLYNVGSVSQAYLKSGKPSKGAATDAINNFDTFTTGYGNTPRVVADALQLWNGSSNHKGMISTWTPPSGVAPIDAQKVSGMGTYGKKDPNKYAFQFLYNPQPITMAYRGAPAIDVTQYTSGSEEYALWAGGGSGGTVTFDLLLMRMYDMPYYKEVGKKGVCTNTNIYLGRKPLGESNKGSLFNEQDAIYNKGTMYDLEFLFRTVLGITIDSKLRGKTADIGWIGAMPVELHLGPGLRYWGTLTGLTVNHVIFNERMVPIFSTVAVTFDRLPDYNWSAAPSAGTVIGTSAAGDKRIATGDGGFRVNGGKAVL